MDFDDDVVLMGHDGPCHPGIAEGKIKVKPLTVYHGKVGQGLSVEMSVLHGPVTLLSVVETSDGKILFLVAEAESVPGRYWKLAIPIVVTASPQVSQHLLKSGMSRGRRIIARWAKATSHQKSKN